jgi:argininosuccinate lyase
MYRELHILLDDLEVRPVVLRSRVDADYSTMTELADRLYRDTGVPFRTGYGFASALTSHGRAVGKRPMDLTWREANRIYREQNGTDLPLSAAVFAETLDSQTMITARRGIGGPQPAETRRMLGKAEADNAQNRQFLADWRKRIADASELRRQLLSNLRMEGSQ